LETPAAFATSAIPLTLHPSLGRYLLLLETFSEYTVGDADVGAYSPSAASKTVDLP